MRPAGLASFYGVSGDNISGSFEQIFKLSTVPNLQDRVPPKLSLPVTIWGSFWILLMMFTLGLMFWIVETTTIGNSLAGSAPDFIFRSGPGFESLIERAVVVRLLRQALTVRRFETSIIPRTIKSMHCVYGTRYIKKLAAGAGAVRMKPLYHKNTFEQRYYKFCEYIWWKEEPNCLKRIVIRYEFYRTCTLLVFFLGIFGLWYPVFSV